MIDYKHYYQLPITNYQLPKTQFMAVLSISLEIFLAVNNPVKVQSSDAQRRTPVHHHRKIYSKDFFIDFQKNVWSQTSEVLETSEVFSEIIYLNVYSSVLKTSEVFFQPIHHFEF
jgi:hypothetical protein